MYSSGKQENSGPNLKHNFLKIILQLISQNISNSVFGFLTVKLRLNIYDKTT